jgi:hypothetical protein
MSPPNASRVDGHDGWMSLAVASASLGRDVFALLPLKHDVSRECNGDCAGQAVNAQFSEESRPMGMHRVRRDAQTSRDADDSLVIARLTQNGSFSA